MREIYGEQFAGTEKFLDSATYGLPSRRQVDALRTALDDWESGTQDTSVFDEAVDASRAAFASLVGASTGSVTIGSDDLGAGGAHRGGGSGRRPHRCAARRVHQRHRTVRRAVGTRSDGRAVRRWDAGGFRRGAVQRRIPARPFDLVAVSLVQSADGRLLDTERLRRAVAGTGTRVVIDVTQAVGWKKIDLGWADAVVASGYKWLLAPRGTAWMALTDSLAATLIPHTAGWYSSETPWANTYEHPPLLAADARRFDASPAWHPMLGSGISLPWLASLDMREVEAHCVGLANRVREAAGMEPADSAIAALDVPGIEAAVADAGIRAAVRAGRVRVGFHLYNTTTDADALIGALRRVR